MKVGTGVRRLWSLLLLAPLVAQAQTYSRTDTIVYADNLSKWVVGQTKTVTCASSSLPDCSGQTVVEVTYDPVTANQLTFSSFGKPQQTLTYNADGTVATVKDGNNNVTTLSSWKRGIPQNIKYPITPESPSGAIQSAVVNNAGWIMSVTDENGAGFTTSYEYDAMGRLSRIVYPIGDSTAWNDTVLDFEKVAAAEYLANHWRQTITTGNARKITYFDALWRPVVTREYDTANEAGTKRFQRFAYDHNGRVEFASYPGSSDALTTGIWTDYDALGRVTSVSQDSELTSQDNELGLLISTTEYLPGFKTRVTNPRLQQTTTSYMAYDQPTMDWPVAITHPEGAITSIGRDVFGKPLNVLRRNAGNTVWNRRYWAYDAYQRVCRTTEVEAGTTVYGYDEVGNLTWSAAAQPWAPSGACPTKDTASVVARRVDRTYDARNRVKTLIFPDGKGDQSWNYFADGLPADITTYNDPANTNAVVNAYTYNKRRLLTAESINQPAWYTWTVGYDYNSNGHLASQTYPSGLNVTYAPNALGQATQAGSYATGVQYYPNGAIKQFSYGNGIVHTMTQNARQLPIRTTDCTLAGTCVAANRRLDLGYGFDAHGNVSNITDYTTGARQSRAMTYDNLDRLTQTTSTMFGTASYGYDVQDNLTTLNVSGGSQARNYGYGYDASNRLINVTIGVGGPSVVGLGYDAQGNLSNKNGVLHKFDYGNRLREVIGKESYRYDALGRRVLGWRPTLGNIRSQYSQGGQLMYTNEDANRGGKRKEYVSLGGSLVAIQETPTAGGTAIIKYQHTDALGTPIATTDANKAFIEKFEYEPYGQLVNSTLKDGPGYTGHVQDASSGLTYMQQRYYDPMIGRFLSVDPVTANSGTGANFNRYWYANNNPYRFTDPDGRETFDCRSSKTCASEIKVADLKKGDVVKTDGATVRVGAKEITVSFNKGYENGASAARTGPNIVPAGPQGASLGGNAAQAKEMSATGFRDQVKNKGPWDYKQQGGQHQPFGNFNYGLTGTAARFPSAILFQEAGIAQSAAGTSLPSWGSPGLRGRPWTGSGSFGDDPVDQFWIQQGIRQYENWQPAQWVR